MKRISLITLLFCCALTAKAQVNLVLNGSFELNNPLIFIDTATGVVSGDSCYHDMITKIDYENVILYSYHFGNESTTLLVKDSCLVCFPSVYWGGGGGGPKRKLFSCYGRRIFSFSLGGLSF